MNHEMATLAWLSLTLFTVCFPTVKADVCLLVYQLGDNNLESFIRRNNYQLLQSAAIRDPSLTTWVYFDSRNYLGTAEDITDPLIDVYYVNGTVPTTKQTGSLYMTWNHGLEKMVINKTLAELDGNDPETVLNFVTHAVKDCVEKGSDEFMIIFSSEAFGLYGFGLDENARQRNLQQANSDLADVLRRSLEYVAGGPSKFDVIGFDADFMQTCGIPDVYSTVSKHYMASQATEPEHGWDYRNLSTASSALDISKDIVAHYTGGNGDMLPATLSLIDLQLYEDFLQVWEALFAELTSLLSTDPDVLAHLNRAQFEAAAFQSVLDNPFQGHGFSAIDVGSYLSTFQNFCVPWLDTNLATLLDSAQITYNNMFVARGAVGAGRTLGTGMSVTFPDRRSQLEPPDTIIGALLRNSAFAMTGSPDFQRFLDAYYSATSPSTTTTNVCTEKTIEPEIDGRLILNQSFAFGESTVHLDCEITRNTDGMVTFFGIQVLIPKRRRRNLLRHHTLSVSAGTRFGDRKSGHFRSLLSAGDTKWNNANRMIQEEKAYLNIYGGEVVGTFWKSSYKASWDRKFYLLSDGKSSEVVYATNTPDESFKYIFVLYLNQSSSVCSLPELDAGVTYSDARYMIGAQDGALRFPIQDGTVKAESIRLFTWLKADSMELIETPLAAGGCVVPLTITYHEIFVGGFNGTVIPWREGSALSLELVSSSIVANRFESSTFFVAANAYDYSENLTHAIDFVAIKFDPADNILGLYNATRPNTYDGIGNGTMDRGNKGLDETSIASNLTGSAGSMMNGYSGLHLLLTLSVVVFVMLY